ncbi:MAG: hypothetical protein EOO75_18540 [Myxococcales bacterium]|nr:MAG: hypothetical protein EOO75_18540 [Myxococcales bacterium]
MTDERLREAGDPTTASERLGELLRRGRQGGEAALLAALVRNPSLPLDALGDALRSTREPWCPAAWHNPSVPLLLLATPSPAYVEAALGALLHVERGWPVGVVPGTITLERRVRFWSDYRPRPSDPWGPVRIAEARSFARHLAGLFGLPDP